MEDVVRAIEKLAEKNIIDYLLVIVPIVVSVVAIIISVALSEFLGRCFESATIKKEEKEFNFKTHKYDSVKNKKMIELENNQENRIKNI